jgi:hypothetical protein
MDFLTSPAGLAVLGVAAFVVGKLIFKVDERVEDRRRSAMRLAGRLRELGFTRLPPLLEDYAVGDYSGVTGKLRELTDIFGDEKERQAEFEKVFRLILEAKFKDPEKRGSLLKLVDDLRAVNDPTYKPPVKAA